MKKSKFDLATRDDLLKIVLEQEDELAKLRPAPAKFKLGQLVAQENRPNFKHPVWNGQPSIYFTVLSVENRHGDWYYGYAKSASGFLVFAEKQLRELNKVELEGVVAPADASPAEEPAPTVHAPASTAPADVVTHSGGAYNAF